MAINELATDALNDASGEGEQLDTGEVTQEDAQAMQAMQRNAMELQQKKQALDQMRMQMMVIEEEEAEFWKTFDEHRDGAYYDAIVDEIQATPTYRLSTLGAITELMHQGVQIPQEILIRYLDIEESVKEEWQGMLGQQQNQAAQMQQAQQQFMVELEKLKGEMQIMKQKVANEGNVEVATIKAGAPAEGGI
jgi:hypothetical protein